MLTVEDHSRDSIGMTYVYPVLSRRAGGLSVGINLNPNNKCNWRCIYCQVPNLKRGSAPEIDLGKLESELHPFLQDVVNGTFFDRENVEPTLRNIKDIALSGNGESTSATEFDQIIILIGKVMREFDLVGNIKLVLITNGSYIQRSHVQKGLQTMAELNGEVWFKLDSATETGMKNINSINRSINSVMSNLDRACRLCPTWLQTCVFKKNGQPPSEKEQDAYISFVQQILSNNTPLKGILLYGLARPSLQPEAPELTTLEPAWLESFAERLRKLSLPVKVSI
ncbi:MAG: radical SAM protein [Gammaproteobacteria bacterium]